MLEVYEKHERKIWGFYKCSCGHGFVRINSSFYTLSPFNKLTKEQNHAKLMLCIYKQVRKCTKCGNFVTPILTDKQKENIEKYEKIMKNVE